MSDTLAPASPAATEALEPWQLQPESDTPGIFVACTTLRQRDAVIEALLAATPDLAALREDAEILACHLAGRTPDLNTQTPEEFAATEAVIQAVVERCLPKERAGPRDHALADAVRREAALRAENERLRAELETFVRWGDTAIANSPPPHVSYDIHTPRDGLRRRITSARAALAEVRADG